MQAPLVWGLYCQAVSKRQSLFLAFLIGFFVRPGIPFLRPDPQYWKAGARRSCQGWPSHQPFHPALRLPGHTTRSTGKPARAGAVKVGRRTNLSTPLCACQAIRPAVLESRRAQELSRLAVAPTFPPRSALARPYLDSSEHGGTLDAVGMTIRGEPAFGRADQSRHILVFGGSKGSEP